MKKDYTTYTMNLKDESGAYPDLLSEKIEPDKEIASQYRGIQERFNRIYDRMVGFYEDY